MRSARIFSASLSAWCSVSVCVTPSRTSSPGPILPVTSPSTVTCARLTRWTSALKASPPGRIALWANAPSDVSPQGESSPLSQFAQLSGRVLRRVGAHVHAGAELEPGRLADARQDLDPPAELLRAGG